MDADAGGDRGEGAADPGPTGAFGAYLRTQRQLARLSLRQLARLTRVSDPYLSQIERGLHQPSVAVIRSLADALELSAEELLAHAAGLDERGPRRPGTEAVIRDDPRLSASQKRALLAVYRSMVEDTADGGAGAPDAAAPVARGARRTGEGPKKAAGRAEAGGGAPRRAAGRAKTS